MCGIAGVLRAPDAAAVVGRMSATLVHRGPDASGLWVDQEGRIALAHRRLAIIDLSERGAQPMRTADGRYTLVYNGEIYNYRELRAELTARGVLFASDSDTEVLLQGFRVWGEGVLRKLNGMFAFAVYDSRERRCFIARDRLGVKPLYLANLAGNGLLFASELRALLASGMVAGEIDVQALRNFLRFGYVQGPRTILRDVHKLMPGTCMVVDQAGLTSVSAYWRASEAFEQPRAQRTDRELRQELLALLTDAFTRRMIADVPVGIYLSAGIDSALVAAILARSGVKAHAFTLAIGDGKTDESPGAAETAQILGLRHTVEHLGVRDMVDAVRELPEVYDEPLADTSALPTLLVSRAAARHVKVVLSADGGDEIFGGYRRYMWSKNLEVCLRMIPRNVAAAMFRGTERMANALGGAGSIEAKSGKLADVLAEGAPGSRFAEWNALANRGDAGGLLRPEFAAGTDMSAGAFDNDAAITDSFMLRDMLGYLPDDILMKVDRATMAASIEGRDPLLDYRIVELAATLPSRLKVGKGGGKVILRQLLQELGVPGPILRPKRGFSVPIRRWLNEEWRDLVAQYLRPAAFERIAAIDPRGLANLNDRLRRGDARSVPLAYALLTLSLWSERWLRSQG